MAKQKSRTGRWEDAAGEARDAFDEIGAAFDSLQEKIDALRDVQEEYQEWSDNLPENLEQSALGEKLQAVLDIELPEDVKDYAITDIEEAIDQAEGAELPLGFGRD
jgi:hypothetical protein